MIQFTLIIGQRRTVEGKSDPTYNRQSRTCESNPIYYVQSRFCESKSDPTYNCQSRTCESEAPPQGFQGPRAQKLLGPHHKAS